MYHRWLEGIAGGHGGVGRDHLMCSYRCLVVHFQSEVKEWVAKTGYDRHEMGCLDIVSPWPTSCTARYPRAQWHNDS